MKSMSTATPRFCGCCAMCSASPVPSSAAARRCPAPAPCISTARRSAPAKRRSTASATARSPRSRRSAPGAAGRGLAEGVAGPAGGAVRLLPVRPDHVGGGAAEGNAAQCPTQRAHTHVARPSRGQLLLADFGAPVRREVRITESGYSQLLRRFIDHEVPRRCAVASSFSSWVTIVICTKRCHREMI